MGSTPEALGSRVPACPTLTLPSSFLTLRTASAEEMPTGLSRLKNPFIVHHRSRSSFVSLSASSNEVSSMNSSLGILLSRSSFPSSRLKYPAACRSPSITSSSVSFPPWTVTKILAEERSFATSTSVIVYRASLTRGSFTLLGKISARVR